MVVAGPRKGQIEKAPKKISGKSDGNEVEPEAMDVEKITQSRVENRHGSLRRNLKEALSFTPCGLMRDALMGCQRASMTDRSHAFIRQNSVTCSLPALADTTTSPFLIVATMACMC